MSLWIAIPLIAALLGTALITGLLFAFSVTVMKALSRLPAAEGMRAMQTINRVILNPLFFTFFLGTTMLSVAIIPTILLGWAGDIPGAIAAATALYLAGVFGLTAAGNVPMNNQLDAQDPSSDTTYWEFYLRRWTTLNHIRTTAGTIAIALYAVGFLQTSF